MKKLLTFLLAFHVQLALAQDPPLQIQFERAEFQLYTGYVNRTQVNFLFVAGKHPRFKFQAIARGATIEYDETGLIGILPTEPEVRLRVYAEMKDKLHWAGEFIFKCIPPTYDAEFRELRLTKSLYRPINFTLTGKDVIKDPDIIPEIVSTVAVDLTEGVENKLTLVATQKYGEYARRLLDDYIVQSDGAAVKKINRLVFSVTPNPGVKSCKLVVSLQGEKVGEVSLPVVPK